MRLSHYTLALERIFVLGPLVVLVDAVLVVASGSGAGRRHDDDLVLLARRLELRPALPQESQPLSAVFSPGVVQRGEASLVLAQEEFRDVGKLQQVVDDVVAGRRGPEGVVQRRPVVVVADRRAGETDLVDEEADHRKVPPPARNV